MAAQYRRRQGCSPLGRQEATAGGMPAIFDCAGCGADLLQNPDRGLSNLLEARFHV